MPEIQFRELVPVFTFFGSDMFLIQMEKRVLAHTAQYDTQWWTSIDEKIVADEPNDTNRATLTASLNANIMASLLCYHINGQVLRFSLNINLLLVRLAA